MCLNSPRGVPGLLVFQVHDLSLTSKADRSRVTNHKTTPPTLVMVHVGERKRDNM